MLSIVSHMSLEVDDVDDDESGDDELPSLQELFSPAMQACQANLKVS
jgi:hypothetical protein